MSTAQLLWKPTDEQIKRTQMHAFMVKAAKKYGFQPDYPSMHKWSVEHRDCFWQEMWDYAGIQAIKPATAVQTGRGMLGTKWFPGLEFNFAAHLLRFNDDRVAIEAEDEQGRTRTSRIGRAWRSGDRREPQAGQE